LIASLVKPESATQAAPFSETIPEPGTASTRKVYLNIITAQSSYRGGQYLNLLFTVGAGTAITPNDIFALNTGYSPYKVVGFDATTNSSVTMTGKVKTTLEVVR